MIDFEKLGVSDISVRLVEIRLPLVALSAKWHVHICTSDQSGTFLRSSSEGETRILFTQLANGAKLLNLFTLWNQVDNVLKRTAQKRSLK